VIELIISIRPHEIRTLGSAIQVTLCSKGAVKTPEYPACYRLAFIRQHYLDSTIEGFDTKDLQEAKALLEELAEEH
jgi:hypothetical protein